VTGTPDGPTVATIEVPAEPTFFDRYNPPPQRLALPLSAGPRFSIALALAGAMGALFLFATVLVLIAAPTLALGIRDALFVTLGLTAIGAFGVCFTAAALAALRDLAKGSPLLVLAEHTLLDRRLMRRPVLWSDAIHATLTYTGGGVGGVHLKFRRAVEARQNPFRVGTLGFYWRRQPDELHVSVIGLDISPHKLAHAVVALVRRHGGTADTKLPNSGTMAMLGRG
jgi:hypothetical protein